MTLCHILPERRGWVTIHDAWKTYRWKDEPHSKFNCYKIKNKKIEDEPRRFFLTDWILYLWIDKCLLGKSYRNEEKKKKRNDEIFQGWKSRNFTKRWWCGRSQYRLVYFFCLELQNQGVGPMLSFFVSSDSDQGHHLVLVPLSPDHHHHHHHPQLEW